MTGTSRDLEAELAALAAALRAVERRVGAVEGALRARPAAAAAAIAPTALAPPRPVAPPADFLRSIPLLGRLLLVLGGAYLLRAWTESGQVPVALGAAAALLYALVWVAAAGRAGRDGQALNAVFHAVGAALVAFPLLVETTTRFGILSPAAGAAAAGLVVLAMGWVAVQSDQRGVAWVAEIGAVGCVLFLLVRPGGAVPYGALLVGLAAASRWVARSRGWPALPWLPALAADAAAVVLTSAATGTRADAPAGAAILVQMALAVTHVAAVSRESVRSGRRPTPFDLLQTVLVLALGFGGALQVAGATGTAKLPLALLCLAAGVAAYAVAFRVVRRQDRGPYLYLTSVALVVVVLASLALLARPAIPWAVLGVAMAWVGSRWRRVVLSLHGAAYAAAAAVTSGLLSTAMGAWTLGAGGDWPSITAPAALALAAVALTAWFTVRTDNPFWREVALLPKFVSFALFVVAGGGTLVLILAPAVAGVPGPKGDAAALSVLRSAVLAVGTLACAWVARTEHLRLARWIVYPVLVLGAIKLLVEDLPHGTPATLAVSFLLYGSALILGPRLARRRAAAPSPIGPCDPLAVAAPAAPLPREGQGSA